MLDHLTDAIVFCDARGIIEYVNPAWRRMTGYDASEAIGRTPASLLRSDHHPPEFWQEVWQTVTRGDVWDGQVVSRHKDGRLLPQDATIVPIALLMRRRPPVEADMPASSPASVPRQIHPPAPTGTQGLLVIAGIACCVAMSMPQVHLVAYCGDLGYGEQRGAEMLSVMLSLGIVSRLASGFIADRIGGLGTVLLGSALQGLALLLYLPFDGLMSLYIVSAIFGLSQGGIVPSYALVVRDFFPARQAATRISLVFTATIAGMALGGWVSGEIYDLTGSYQAAFLNGIAWNLVNLSIVTWLLLRRRRWRAAFG